ncbi:hypothetical protein Tdes44962_MAKER03011 [Teratosphaeria destructans]|uniref:Uncharacterized protein n=1 Tax=Teratosphaeria destructans TaxID=418781 RepID=A0A9W7SRD1_9PEZI|nr:hypothetical protein Tdes44962_MAKER03011 [Teratosphaeria destructans]
MSEDTTSNNTSTQPHTRRSSLAGQTFADLFGSGRTKSTSATNDGPNSPPQQHQYAGPITQAAAEAQRRRLSLTTLGLSGSPNSTSPFGSYRGVVRRDSIGSVNSGSIDESAIEDDAAPRDSLSGPTPTTPFARRMSFGARALRDVRNGTGGGGGIAGQNGTLPPAPTNSSKAPQNGTISSRTEQKGRGSVDFWTENLRNRAERTSSIGGAATSMPQMHARAKSIAMMESPIKEMPPAREEKRPDLHQERMLRGELSWD